jgi:hypothetical protein
MLSVITLQEQEEIKINNRDTHPIVMQCCLLLDVLYDQVFDLDQNTDTDTDIDQACTTQGETGRSNRHRIRWIRGGSITRKQFGDASMIYRDGYFMTSLFLLLESMMTLGTSAPPHARTNTRRI